MEDSAAERAVRFGPMIAALHADRVAAEVIPAFRHVGIRPILLKGAAIAAWLYRDGARPYDDVDLLVEDRFYDDAAAVLRELGFRRGKPGWRDVSWSWLRREDGAIVDLHRSLVGVGAAPKILWRELTKHVEMMSVGAANVEVFSQPALALHVALHAGQHGGDQLVKPREDLSRAVAGVDERCWREAAELADHIDATPAFATGLRLDPGGAALADRMRLPRARPLEVALHATSRPALVLAVEYLRTAGSSKARIRFLARKLAPPPRELRARSALARRGPLGLCLGYLWRPTAMTLQAPAGLLAWRKARREERSTGAGA